MMPLLALLVLSPVLMEDTDLRLVSSGTEGLPVSWHLDGVWVATTGDNETESIRVDAGAHELTASSPHPGAWTVLARPEPQVDGITYVPGWTATAVPKIPGNDSAWEAPWLPVVAALGALTGLLWPHRGAKQPREA